MTSLILSVVALAWTAIATVTDVRSHQIWNWNTYSGIIVALGVRGACDGFDGVWEGCVGLLACGGLMVVCFVLFNVGGGDVKLLAMLGTFFGLEQGIEVMLWTFTFGCLTAIALIIWKAGAWNLLRGLCRHLYLIGRSRGWVPLAESERAPLQTTLYLAPSALLAVIIVCVPLWKRTLT